MAGVIILPLQLILVGLSVRAESSFGHTIALILSSCELCLVIFTLVWIFIGASTTLLNEYEPAWKREVAYAAMAIPLLVATFIVACICRRNFGHGLKPLLRLRRVSAEAKENISTTYHNLSNHDDATHELQESSGRVVID
jgi:hypothetical protein